MFGDSIGKGVIFDAIAGKYQFIKDNFIKLFSGGSGIEVKNFSSFGCTVTKGMTVLGRHEAELRDKTGVILEFGGNDCDFNWEEISQSPLEEHSCHTPMDIFKRTYRAFIEKIRSAGCAPILMNLPPIDPDRYFSHISRNLSAENILLFLGDVDRIYRWQEYYSLTVNSLAAEVGAPLIDVRGAFLQKRRCFDLLCEDGIHPNPDGHAFISEVIGAELKSLIA
jgi:lysophospholipase L1-like esterase